MTIDNRYVRFVMVLCFVGAATRLPVTLQSVVDERWLDAAGDAMSGWTMLVAGVMLRKVHIAFDRLRYVTSVVQVEERAQ